MLTYAGAPFSKNGKVKGRRSDIAVIGFPSDLGATTRGGQAAGPSCIRLASGIGKGFYPDIELGTFSGRICDCGDLTPEERNLDSYIEDVRANVYAVARHARTVAALCGDDGITYGVAMGLRDAYGDLAVLHYDAHADMYGDGSEPLDHSNWMIYLSNSIDGPIMQKGCRAPTEYEPLADAEFGDRPLLIAVDMDVIDPAFAPGVSCPYPLGMTPSSLMDDLLYYASKYNIVGISVSEVNPDRDVNGVTAHLAAEILNRTFAKIVSE